MRRDPEFRRKSFIFYCRLYIVLGLCSLGAGGYLLFQPGGRSEAPMIILAVILILFGLIRIGNALFQLRRLSRPRP